MTPHPRPTMEDRAVRDLLDERIAELLRWRRWRKAEGAIFTGPEWQRMAEQDWLELKALLRLRRRALGVVRAEADALAAGDFYAGMAATR